MESKIGSKIEGEECVGELCRQKRRPFPDSKSDLQDFRLRSAIVHPSSFAFRWGLKVSNLDYLGGKLFATMETVSIICANFVVQKIQPFMVSSIMSDDGALEDSLCIYLFSLGLKKLWDPATVPFFFTNYWWVLKSFSLKKLSIERASVVAKLLQRLKPKQFAHSDFSTEGMGMDIDTEQVILLNCLVI